MKSLSILLTIDFTVENIATLQNVADYLVFHQVPTCMPRLIANALDTYPDSEILYAVTIPDVWNPLWNIRWIQLHWAGVDHLSLKRIPPSVRLTTTSGVHAVVLAEHTFALILALRRRLHYAFDLQRQAIWAPKRQELFQVNSPILRKQTLGILGYGSIGREIARIAHAWGMQVLAYKRDPAEIRDTGFVFSDTGDPFGSIPMDYYGPDRLHDVLRKSDVLVNVLPLTAQTKGLLDAASFAVMKPGAIFINIGRGETVDETALVEALQTNHLAGAGLDVFATEPLPADSNLWHLENVIISPHIGGMFSQYNDFCLTVFQENLTRYLVGEPLLNEVNRDFAY